MVLCQELPDVLHCEAWCYHSSGCPVFSRAGSSLRMSKNLSPDGDKKIHDKTAPLTILREYGFPCTPDLRNCRCIFRRPRCRR